MTQQRPNRDPEKHNDDCNHDRPLVDDAGKPLPPAPYEGEYEGPSTGTCAECGARDCCVGCRSSDGECYCEPS